MKTRHKLIEDIIEMYGGQSALSKAIGIPQSTICKDLNAPRQIAYNRAIKYSKAVKKIKGVVKKRYTIRLLMEHKREEFNC